MEPIDEFRNVGKRIPYKVPDDFFGKFPQETLFAAKQRERKSRRILYVWRPLAVAASLAVFAVVGYFMIGPDKLPESQPLVQEAPLNEQNSGIKPDEPKQQAMADPGKSGTVKKSEQIADKLILTEKMDEILADMTDDELIQFAAMIKTDPFAIETEQ